MHELISLIASVKRLKMRLLMLRLICAMATAAAISPELELPLGETLLAMAGISLGVFVLLLLVTMDS